MLILVVACASVQARSPIKGLFKQIMEEFKADPKCPHVPHVPNPHGKKIELVVKAGKKNVDCEDCDDCPDNQECDPDDTGAYPDDASCCPYVEYRIFDKLDTIPNI